MPFRKRTFRRRPRRTRRIIRRTADFTTGTMVRRRLRTPMVHSFKRMARDGFSYTGNVAYNPLLVTWSANWINLALVVNASDFANLYDQYRINFVVFKVWLKIDPGAQTAATASYPKLYWYRDYDDNTAPGSLNEMRENVKCKVAVLNPNRPITIKFKPNTLQLLYQSTIANQFKPVFGQWLDMSSTNTPHYGIKVAIDDLTNTNYKVEVETTFYFQCRQPR